jgi:hypothetical protein
MSSPYFAKSSDLQMHGAGYLQTRMCFAKGRQTLHWRINKAAFIPYVHTPHCETGEKRPNFAKCISLSEQTISSVFGISPKIGDC